LGLVFFLRFYIREKGDVWWEQGWGFDEVFLRVGEAGGALDMRDYCFAMKSLSLGIVRASVGVRGVR
jgi:hypothetical protein